MRQPEDCVITGRALLGEELLEEDVSITVSGGIITSIEPVSRTSGLWIVPAFFNAHTHLGDTVAMDIPARGSLAGLVKPPNGLKHRILAATPRADLVRGMRASITTMMATGTAGFADFREGGADGVAALREAAAGLDCFPVILGRDGGETVGDGAGISSVHDVKNAEEIVRTARAAGKLVAFHAGEKSPTAPDRRYGNTGRRLPQVELGARRHGITRPPTDRAHHRTRRHPLPRDGQRDVCSAGYAPGDGVYCNRLSCIPGRDPACRDRGREACRGLRIP